MGRVSQRLGTVAPWLRRLTAAGAVTALLLAGCTGSDNGAGGAGDDSERTAVAVEAVVDAWSALEPRAFGEATSSPPTARAGLAGMIDDLEVTRAVVAADGAPECTDSTCRQTVRVNLELAGIGSWEYDTTATVDASAEEPRVDWRPGLLHPRLTGQTALERIRRVPPRAPILDRKRYLLTSQKPVFRIGVEPRKAKPATYPRLERLLGIDGAALRERAQAADPSWFVDVITYRVDDYRPIRERLFQIPGVVVDFTRLALGPSSSWGRAVLGSVSPATEETLSRASQLALDTDMIGSSGLQAAYEQQLAGTPGGIVALVDTKTGQQESVLWRKPAEKGEPLQTTLSYDVQKAGENAVADQDKTTVLVAVDARTGEVLADVNGPEITSYDTGLVGRYPPGSTFKVVSTAALIEAGQDVDQKVACPSRTVVDGKRFKNYEFSSLPRGSTFADALAASCNTTVVDRARKLSDDALHVMAEQFGVGAEWDLPLPAYSGSVPVASSLVDRAASMIGQGRVLMSPLGMAMVAAAVSSGQPRTPSLVTGDGGDPVGSLRPSIVRDLQRIMRLVVTDGTASTLRGLPGDVAAKTGTAEYGDELPLRTHGWMIGYRGNLAFACLVVDGDGGNSDAGPVVRAFLREAPRSW
jgi:cell division protein FtsI/penicillin-binding protein 2